MQTQHAWNDFITSDQLVARLYEVSKASRHKAPEELDQYVEWLQCNMPEFHLTRDECLSLIYVFSFALENAQKEVLDTFYNQLEAIHPQKRGGDMRPDPEVVACIKQDAALQRLLKRMQTFRADLLRLRMEQSQCAEMAQSPAAYHEAIARTDAVMAIYGMIAEYPGMPVNMRVFNKGHEKIRLMRLQAEYLLELLDMFDTALVEAQGDA